VNRTRIQVDSVDQLHNPRRPSPHSTAVVSRFFDLVFRSTVIRLPALSLACLLVLAPAFVAAQESSAATPGVRRALLIGINRYRAVPELQGSVNDVETMREILTTRYGFERRYVTLLTDEAATRRGILEALEKLVQDSGPQDTVYVHYSGHGSQVEDSSGTHENRVNQTIVPQDGRTSDVPDILSLELAVILARLRAQSAAIVLDSCHSGGATRAIEIRARSVPADTRLDLYRRAAQTRGIVSSLSSRFVVLEATAPDQLALDGPIDGRYHGFFTYALSKSISHAHPGATLREIFAGVGQELARLQVEFNQPFMPEPQLEGPPALFDHPLFASVRSADPASQLGREPRLPWAAVLPRTPTEGSLVKAVLLGAAPGSKWAVYPPGETQFTPGAALGTATVLRLENGDAIAHLDWKSHPFPAGSRAVALMPTKAPERVPVRLLNMSPQQRAQVTQILSRDIVNLVGPNEPARFLVDVQGSDVRLLTADGLQVVGQFAQGGPQTTDEISRLLDRSSKAAEILALDNAASRISITARVSGRPSVQKRGIALVADTRPAALHVRKAGESRAPENSLQLEVRANADVYVTIVDVDSSGGINLLFPNDYQAASFYPDGLLRATDALLVPDSLQPGNRAGFYWDYSPPLGADTIRVFASSDLATARVIRDTIKRLHAVSSAGARGLERPAVVAGINGLREALTDVATRGVQLVSGGGPAEAGGTSGSASAQSVGNATANSGAPPSIGGDPVSGDWAAASVTLQIID
jgi:hypothetical protein